MSTHQVSTSASVNGITTGIIAATMVATEPMPRIPVIRMAITTTTAIRGCGVPNYTIQDGVCKPYRGF